MSWHWSFPPSLWSDCERNSLSRMEAVWALLSSAVWLSQRLKSSFGSTRAEMRMPSSMFTIDVPVYSCLDHKIFFLRKTVAVLMISVFIFIFAFKFYGLRLSMGSRPERRLTHRACEQGLIPLPLPSHWQGLPENISWCVIDTYRGLLRGISLFKAKAPLWFKFVFLTHYRLACHCSGIISRRRFPIYRCLPMSSASKVIKSD